jgi:hypothetical protein
MNTQPLLSQLRTASEHPRVSALGAALGGFPPASAYLLTHYALRELWASPDAFERARFWLLLPVVAACLVFSVRTVWQWGNRSSLEKTKATCLVIALEGVMVLAPIPALSAVALAMLVVINAIATACTLVAEDAPSLPAPAPSVTAVSRELGLPRKAAAKVLERRARQTSEQPA